MLPIEKNKDVIEKINKLYQRIECLKESKFLFVAFLTKSQQLYGTQTKKIKQQIEVFEQSLVKKSFLSIGKCKEMKNMTQIFRQYCVYLEAIAKVNLIDLKRVDNDNTAHQKKVSSQALGIINQISLYQKDQSLYNDSHSNYDSHCQKLNESMEKFKEYENPIIFYSQSITGEYSKNLDKKFQLCENSETGLINDLQVLDQKRKLLSERLKQIKEQYVFLLHKHMQNIKKSANYLVDQSKDQMYEGIKSNKTIENIQADIFSEEFERFNDKYSKNENEGDDELFKDLKDLLGVTVSSISINSDYKLFLDRCQRFRDKKIESVSQTLYLQRKFAKQINMLIKSCEELQKQFKSIEKEVFKSNGVDNYKKRFRTFFGENFLSISELCFFITDNPHKRFDKIKKSLMTGQQKLKKILQKKEEEFKIFKKRANMILQEHNISKKSIEKQKQMSLESASKFKNSVQKTSANFRNVVKQFIKKQDLVDEQFDHEIKIMKGFIQKQSGHSFLSYLLGKQKQKYRLNILNKINIDNEIISIVKEDSRYQVLFTEPLKPYLFQNFQSKIQRGKYEETKRVLQKKQFQSRALMGNKTISCCGMKQNVNFQSKVQHNCDLIQQKKLKSGSILIGGKGFMFKESSKNPFADKLQIMVPINQILFFGNKNIEGVDGFQVATMMGNLTFFSSKHTETLASLQKYMGHKVGKQKNDSRRDKRNDSSSSFMKHNSSTQFKISYENSYINQPSINLHRQSTSKKEKNNNLKDLADRWMIKNFLSEGFAFVTRKQSQKNSVREDFKYKDHLITFILKEKRKIRNSSFQNVLFFDYEWKISFPDHQMFRSYRHSQMIKIQTEPQIVKVLVVEKRHQEENLYARKKFYSQIEKMNKKLCDFVVQVCQRQAQVVFEEERLEQQSEQMIELKDINLQVKDSEKGDGRMSRVITSSQLKIIQNP